MTRAEREAERAPLLSIGVTTYDRPALLAQAVNSIMQQSSEDFEVLIGNDDVTRTLTMDDIGLTAQDSGRVEMINRDTRLGEVENMNDLLRRARGRYFTWLADDDLVAPNFLMSIQEALGLYPDAEVIVTRYELASGLDVALPPPARIVAIEPLSGRQLVRRYFDNSIETIVPYAVFQTNKLRELGGIDSLSSAPVGWNGEYLLTIRCGVLSRVVYVDAPLHFFRKHEGSFGTASRDLGVRRTAGLNLIRTALPLLIRHELRPDLRVNLTAILGLLIHDFAHVASITEPNTEGQAVRRFLKDLRSVLDQTEDRSARREALDALRAVSTPFLWKSFGRHALQRMGVLNVIRALRVRLLK